MAPVRSARGRGSPGEHASVYDGVSAPVLALRLEVPRLVLLESVGSTLDVAHALGEQGTPAGTLVLADHQTAGRGRQGRGWQSEAGRGIWLTLVERPVDHEALAVLSLRLGLHAAGALSPFADAPIRLKWPNDLLVGGRKVAGILVEARWRKARAEWIAIGFGVNVRPPLQLTGAGALAADTDRIPVLEVLVPVLRAAALAAGALTEAELRQYASLDAVHGRRCVEPVAGVVAGIDSRGQLLVDTAAGRQAVRSGSLVLADDEEGDIARADGTGQNGRRASAAITAQRD